MFHVLCGITSNKPQHQERSDVTLHGIHASDLLMIFRQGIH